MTPSPLLVTFSEWFTLLRDIAIINVCPGLGLQLGNFSNLTDMYRTFIDSKLDGESYHDVKCFVEYGASWGQNKRYDT
jgi:hypothetical protein